jgi:hypothetical protein
MKGKRKRLWRKMCKDTSCLGEWLHKWWKLNVIEKNEYKKRKKIVD